MTRILACELVPVALPRMMPTLQMQHLVHSPNLSRDNTPMVQPVAYSYKGLGFCS